jgi:hypothetical protein
MNVAEAIQQFKRQAGALHNLVEQVSQEQFRWKPAPEQWSLLEVINHLADEERQDFRTRLDYILHHPGQEWPPIDPQGWVSERGYNQRDPQASLADFLAEREKSLAWLASLGEVDLEKGEKSPWGETFKAGDMLAAWVAHDLLHLRQVIEILYAWHQQAALPYAPQYAGKW